MPEATADTGGATAIRVLLVSNRDEQAQRIATAFEGRGLPFEVVRARTSMPSADSPRFAVVLLDASASDPSNLETLRRLSADIIAPVVVLVVPGDEGWAAQALEAGAAEVLVTTDGFLTLLPAVLFKALKHQQLVAEHAQARDDKQRALRSLKAAHERLVKGGALRALGELTAGTAHDLNNLLTAVVTRLQIVMPSVVSPNLRRALQSAERAAADAAEFVRRLQRFARTTPREARRLVDINQIVTEARQITKVLWQDLAQVEGVTIEVVVEAATAPPVMASDEALAEAVTNLVLNAVDALPAGGRITLRTFTSDAWVGLAVSDTGVGMPDEVRRRASEPLFTTKGPADAGLGLSMVADIVREHGGELDIESVEGQGTTVTIRLPRLPQRHDELRAAPAAAAAPVGPLRILLIEDDPGVRDVLDSMLGVLGCKVITAGGGREGLDLLKTESGVDLVLTDLGMPDLNGLEVARTIAAQWPGIRVALVTGWAEGLTLAPEDRERVVGVLPKPVTERAIKELLASCNA